MPTCRTSARQSAPAALRARRSFAVVCLLACLVAFALPQPTSSHAGQGEGFVNREYPLKALFLYNFGGYIEWPAEAFPTDDHPFVVGVLGSAPLHETMREIAATKTIAGRKIVVKQFNSVDTVEPCHILFIARGVQPQHEQQIVDSLRGRPMLLVGESSGFAARGGCVNFYIESNKIRFEINLEAARQQQLKMSAKLLALAKIVP